MLTLEEILVKPESAHGNAESAKGNEGGQKELAVGLGQRNSATAVLARTILELAERGIGEKKGQTLPIKPVYLSTKRMLELTKHSDVGVGFVMAGEDSPKLTDYLRSEKYQLLSVSDGLRSQLVPGVFSAYSIPLHAAMNGPAKNPAQADSKVDTIMTRAVLVANRQVDDSSPLAYRLTKAIYEHFEMLPEINRPETLKEEAFIPLHPQSQEYYRGAKEGWDPSVVTQPLLVAGGLAVFFAPLYYFFWGKKPPGIEVPRQPGQEQGALLKNTANGQSAANAPPPLRPAQDSDAFLPQPGQAADVFLSYNTKDRQYVTKVAGRLKERGISPWLDEEQLLPGRSPLKEMEPFFRSTKVAVVFVGKDGLGKFQEIEQDPLLEAAINRGIPLIPVLLPGAAEPSELPFYLRGKKWVDFRETECVDFRETAPDPFEKLGNGITGQRNGGGTVPNK